MSQSNNLHNGQQIDEGAQVPTIIFQIGLPPQYTSEMRIEDEKTVGEIVKTLKTGHGQQLLAKKSQ